MGSQPDLAGSIFRLGRPQSRGEDPRFGKSYWGYQKRTGDTIPRSGARISMWRCSSKCPEMLRNTMFIRVSIISRDRFWGLAGLRRSIFRLGRPQRRGEDPRFGKSYWGYQKRTGDTISMVFSARGGRNKNVRGFFSPGCYSTVISR